MVSSVGIWGDGNQMATQIKSRERVSFFGEVFTNEREVKAMCDLVDAEASRIESRVLEPACGNGNFLVEVLTRKFKTIERLYKSQKEDFKKNSFIAISSLYGIDIIRDNVQECKDRLFEIWKTKIEMIPNFEKSLHGFDKSIKYVLDCNIICGDSLTMLTDNNTPIVFSEWSLLSGAFVKRRDFKLSTLIKVRENKEQGDLFLSSTKYDTELGSYVPNPIKEYKPIEYWRLSEWQN